MKLEVVILALLSASAGATEYIAVQHIKDSEAKDLAQLKTPCRDGTTHVIFEPQDFIARLAALAPEPRVHLTRFHGVFAPNSKH